MFFFHLLQSPLVFEPEAKKLSSHVRQCKHWIRKYKYLISITCLVVLYGTNIRNDSNCIRRWSYSTINIYYVWVWVPLYVQIKFKFNVFYPTLCILCQDCNSCRRVYVLNFTFIMINRHSIVVSMVTSFRFCLKTI